MPHQVSIVAYNAAGERVRIIYSGAAQYLPGDLNLSDKVVTGGGQLSIRFPGTLATGSNTVVWDVTNDNAGEISGGTYTIKAEIIDNFGQVTSLVQTIQVVPGGVQQYLRIFNGAGEVVRNIQLATPVNGANGLRMSDASFGLEINPVTGAAVQNLKIEVLGNSGYQSLGWDGLNEQGVPVNSGTYVVQLVSKESSREAVVTSRSVTVIKGVDTVDPTASAIIAPNPVLPTNKEIALYYNPAQLMGHNATCRVYNLAGELVNESEDASHSGKMVLGAQRPLASGTYLVRFEVREGAAVIKARVLKMAVVR